MKYNLTRFLEAQNKDYNNALSEIKNGKKHHIGCGIYFLKFQG